MTHGLNLHPAKMEFLSQLLQERGYEVIPLRLQGHGDGLEAFKRATRSTWLQQTKTAAALVRARAGELNVPTIVLGYSLGAVMYADAISGDPRLAFDRQIFFAPAIAPRPRNSLYKIAGIFGPSFCIKSAAPEDYRANDCTPISAYESLFASVKNINGSGFQHLNKPTVVFIDPDDELISLQNLKKTIAEKNLSEWSLVEIDNKGSTLPKSYHHLIIDRPSVGQATWSKIERALLKFLN